MATTSDIRNGMIIEFKDGLYEIIDFLHVKPGKGNTFVRTKLKNVKTGQVLENNFRISEKLNEARIEKSKMQYLYNEGDFYVFMDNETYEQINIPEESIGENKNYLIENIDVVIKRTAEEEIIGVELPLSVIQEIVECEPNVKGNTASGGGKNATTETGLVLTVPFFIEVGQKIKIDTRTGEYMERV